jgi:class III poly(R)-hydroxyalkanoic acid synthase PhaE subunit
MAQKSDNSFENAGKEMFENWVSMTGQFFGNMSNVLNQNYPNGMDLESMGEKAVEQINSAWSMALTSWNSLTESLSNPDESFLSEKSMADRRQALEKIMESMAESFKSFQEKGLEQAEAMKHTWANADFQKIDKEAFKKWESFYQSELSKVLGMPQIGLGREYQEKMAGAFDKFNLFNAALIEFFYFLYLPMEKTFILMQKDIEKMVKEGNLPENSDEYYNMWLKKLEKHYMSMFHSTEYVSVMAKTLESMAQFKSARDLVLEDVVSSMPVPTKTEIDEMYKELAELKRKVKRLEKENSN